MSETDVGNLGLPTSGVDLSGVGPTTPNAPLPTLPKIDTSKLTALLSTQIKQTMSDLGHSATDFETKLNLFLVQISPQVAAALTAGDTMSLSFLKDAVAGRLARLSLGLLYREQVAVQATVMTVCRLLLQVGFSLIA